MKRNVNITSRWVRMALCMSFTACLFVHTPCRAGEIMIAAAASLQDAYTQAARKFREEHPETKVLLHFASSGALAAQIERGAPVDVFAPASVSHMTRLERQGLVIPDSRRDLAFNSLIVAEPQGGNLIKHLGDLAKPAVIRIAVGDPDHVPAGMYAKEALKKEGIWTELREKLVYGVNVRQVRDYLNRGEVDAGLIYATDVLNTDLRIAVRIPTGLHAPIIYPAAVTSASGNPEEARAFIAFMLSGEGKEILSRYGFSVPGTTS